MELFAKQFSSFVAFPCVFGDKVSFDSMARQLFKFSRRIYEDSSNYYYTNVPRVFIYYFFFFVFFFSFVFLLNMTEKDLQRNISFAITSRSKGIQIYLFIFFSLLRKKNPQNRI